MKSRTFVGIGAALGALALVAVPLTASATVDLYENIALGDLGGAQTTVSATRASMPSGWNDRVSSLWVWYPVDYIVLWSDEGFGGSSRLFYSGTDNLNGWGFNDVTSSYQIVNI